MTTRFLTIDKIEIIGLNHKCNVVFDMDKDCTILIGENGVGKTSALKILQFLMSGMMTSVARYVFDYIKITDSDETYSFSKDDFLVPVDVMIEKFSELCLVDIPDEEKPFLKKAFIEMISEIKEKDLLGTLLDELFYGDSFSSVINRIVERYMDADILFKLELEIAFPYPCYKSSAIYSSQFYQDISGEEYYRGEIVFGDMVEKVLFPNNNDNFVHFRLSPNKEDVKKLEPVSEKELQQLLEDIRTKEANRESYAEIVKKLKAVDEENLDEMLEILNTDNVHMYFDDLDSGTGTRQEFDYLPSDDLQKALFISLFRRKNKTKTFDIHSAIKSMYFENDIIEEVNDIAIQGVYNYWEYVKTGKEIDVQELLNVVDKKVLYVHDHYICPILAEELPYRINLSKVLKKIEWCIKNEPDKIQNYSEEICLIYSYMEIFEEIQDIVLFKENVSDPIRAFQDLISQYIDDKTVCVTPKGISVYLKEDKEITYISKVYEDRYAVSEDATEEIVFGDVDTELSLNSLSSGECKIIMLIFYATFSNYSVLIMDEPELSISILWQQRLIVDLLDYGKFANVIVATHSPYIARDNSLAEYIEYLP